MDKGLKFPPRNTRYKIQDYFQVDVDDFIDGEFLFIGAKEVDVVTNEEIMSRCESVAEKGWLISTYCYTYSQYMKFLLVQFKSKPWENNYTIRREFCHTMPIDYMADNMRIETYLEHVEIMLVIKSSDSEQVRNSKANKYFSIWPTKT